MRLPRPEKHSAFAKLLDASARNADTYEHHDDAQAELDLHHVRVFGIERTRKLWLNDQLERAHSPLETWIAKNTKLAQQVRESMAADPALRKALPAARWDK